jgi:hypothetical protein
LTALIDRRQAAVAVVSAGVLPVCAQARESSSQPIKGRNAGVDAAPTIYKAELKTDAIYGEVWMVHLRQDVIDRAVKEDGLLTYFIAVIGKRDARLWEFRLEQ